MRFRSTILALLLVSVFNAPLNAQGTGQLAGRVVRADTGQPIAGAVVTLQATQANPNCPARESRTAKSSSDGSYEITDFLPGCYFIVAYRRGFIGAIYPLLTAKGEGGPVTVTAGQRVGGIDFRLRPAPEVIPMNDQVLRESHPGLRRLDMRFGPARFSPDGRYLALIITTNLPMDDLWRYDTTTQELVALGNGVVDLAWDGDRLYALLRNPELMNGYSVAEVTASGLKQRPQVPFAVQSIFTKWERGEPPTVVKVEQNSRYVVSSDNPCSGCRTEIRVRRKSSKRGHVIANSLDGFLFDGERSVVIYPEAGFTPALVAFDLDSGRSRTLVLPTPYIAALLDGASEPDGYLVAFVSAGSCLPELTPEGQNLWLLPLNDQYRREHSFPENVCFVTVPERYERPQNR